MTRPPESYVHGVQGPVVLLPARVCAWLDRHAQLGALRTQVRGGDAEVDAVLVAMRLAAMTWRASATGSEVAAEAEAPPRSETWLGVRQAAGLLAIGERAVRLACSEGRLDATQTEDGRWRISREAVEHFRAARRRTA